MHIIGGGVIGLSCAWYLRKAGYDVTIIDKGDMQDGCSFGNSGIIVPSHSVPLASPGVIAKGMKWMFSAGSPFYIKPRVDPDLVRWLWQFQKSCTRDHVLRVTPVMRDFHLLSKSLFKTFAEQTGFDFDLEEKGCLMLFRTKHGEQEEKEAAEYAQSLGLNVSMLSLEQMDTLDPLIRRNVLGGVHYHDDAHLYPGKFVLQLQSALKEMGVRFLTSTEVTGFQTEKNKISKLQIANGDVIEVNNVVLTAGAWSGKIVKELGLKLLIQDGKGYSVTLPDQKHRPSLPSILTEARVAVTPMGNDLRIGGTLEVSEFSPQINKKRVQAILTAMSQYYPDFPKLTPDLVKVWHGFRPVSADGVPYIGRSKQYPNLIVAAGHAMLGLSLGPATGLLVSEIAEGKQTSLPMEVFATARHH